MDKKVRNILIAGGVIVVIAIGVISYVVYDTVNSTVTAIQPIKAISVTSTQENSNNSSQSSLLPIQTKTTSTTTNNKTGDNSTKTNASQVANIDTLSKSVNTSNPNAIMPSDRGNSGGGSTSSSNKFNSVYESQFSGIAYPNLLSDSQANIVKIFTVYTLNYLEDMKTLGANTISGKTSKSNYYTQLETLQQGFTSLANSIQTLIPMLNGSAKTNAQNLYTIVNTEALKAQSEFKFIKTSVTFSNAMISDLAFGSSLDSAISQVKTINNNLGTADKSELTSFINRCNALLLPSVN